MSTGYRTRAEADDAAADVVRRLRRFGSEENRIGMARFGINTANAVGVSMAQLRPLARELGRDHLLARALWSSGVHEARILAVLVDEPHEVTGSQMERWTRAFDSWDLCDQACMKLYRHTPFAWAKARAWAGRGEEFVKRAGFALMATLAVHDEAGDAEFIELLPLIEREAGDARNFVKKAVNWALRQIGKRSPGLRKEAVAVARRLAASEDAAARWVGRDALRELLR
ncbi:MAG TPA: DNA alkylation repair protein [Actinomycetota bacterium]|nr:DNA alkylation repair protein [Actinomycetota bacterium]